MSNLKGSLMDELDQFFQAVFKWDIARRFVTPGALSRARRRLSHDVFIDLLDVIAGFLNRKAPLSTFHGLRVFAVDGSTMRVPDNQRNREHFGVQRNQKGRRAMGRVSIFHDVLNRLTYDAILGSYHTSELEMCWDHLETAQIPDNSLILMDRGYYEFTALKSLVDRGYEFCIRLRSNLGIYKSFMKSGLDDLCLTLKAPKLSKGLAKDHPLRQSFTVRIVRYKTKGETYILMTTLQDSRRYSIEDLGHLYHLRWQVEESFKVKKCRLQIESISGTDPLIALQDFHARVLKECLTASMLLDIQGRVEQQTRKRKFRYKPNITQALSKMKNSLALLFLRDDPSPLISDLLAIFSKSLVSVEPNRAYERMTRDKSGPKIITYSFGYRSNR